jgi:hypothetical protein
VAGSAAALLARSGPASAADYPERPITLDHSLPAGRQHHHRHPLGQRQARRGARPADRDRQPRRRRRHRRHRALAKSDPDGYTIGLGYTGTLAIGPNLYSNVGYDPRKDFSSIGRIATAPNTLVVHPSFPPRRFRNSSPTPRQIPARSATARPASARSAMSAASISPAPTGIKLVHIPYKGTGPALSDLVGGHIPVAFAPIPATYDFQERQRADAGGDEPDALDARAGGADHRRAGRAGF